MASVKILTVPKWGGEMEEEKMQRLKSFDELKHGDMIISPIDSEVTQFYIDKDGEKYLAGKKSLFPIYQFDAEDFFRYDGELQNGEIDKAFFER